MRTTQAGSQKVRENFWNYIFVAYNKESVNDQKYNFYDFQ